MDLSSIVSQVLFVVYLVSSPTHHVHNPFINATFELCGYMVIRRLRSCAARSFTFVKFLLVSLESFNKLGFSYDKTCQEKGRENTGVDSNKKKTFLRSESLFLLDVVSKKPFLFPLTKKLFSGQILDQINFYSIVDIIMLFFLFQIYTDWANHYLEKGRSKRRINQLATDCSDGVLLADVIESVSKLLIIVIN